MKDFPSVKNAYDEYPPLAYLQYVFMDFHGEIAKYSDSARIVTNYSGKGFD